MNLRDAKTIAERLVAQMRPFVDRIEIAGSIRRGKQDVKDIELVAVPKIRGELRAPASDQCLFREEGDEPEVEHVNLLHRWALASEVRWIKSGTSDIIDWRPKSDGRYWRALLPEGIKLDLFLTTPEQWGLIFLIRTGSAEFSQGVMTYAKQRTAYHVKGGALLDETEEALPTPEEGDVFNLLELDWKEPRERVGFDSITRGARHVFPPGYGRQFKHHFPT